MPELKDPPRPPPRGQGRAPCDAGVELVARVPVPGSPGDGVPRGLLRLRHSAVKRPLWKPFPRLSLPPTAGTPPLAPAHDGRSQSPPCRWRSGRSKADHIFGFSLRTEGNFLEDPNNLSKCQNYSIISFFKNSLARAVEPPELACINQKFPLPMEKKKTELVRKNCVYS